MKKPNPYLEKVYTNLPRLLSLFDRDQTSETYGMGDRYHWAWGLIDFGNGTFQGAAYGLSLLWTAGLWPYPTNVEYFLDRIDSMFRAASLLTRRDGSLEEAFPREGSYCVTASVAFDLIGSLEMLDTSIEQERRQRWNKTIQPMADFLIRADETHAIISNHLATAVGALCRWHDVTRDNNAEAKAKLLRDRILQNQSDEGWFREYSGADPGYQSLCTYYLADVHIRRPQWELEESLKSSLEFLSHFVHPDGSFGGIYGSRATRFYNPGGIEQMAATFPVAAGISRIMTQSVQNNAVVTLDSIDEPNIVPWFNSYCCAAVEYQRRTEAGISENEQINQSFQLPAERSTPFRHSFAEAGLLIDSGPRHYTVVSTRRGGVVYHFVDGQLKKRDTGAVLQNTRNGRLYSSQTDHHMNNATIEGETLEVRAAVLPMAKRAPTPFQFVILRLMSLTVFRSSAVRETIKRLLVKLLISGTKRSAGVVTRRITLGEDLRVEDRLDVQSKHLSRIDQPTKRVFVPYHMASQGYWQIQDEV